MTNILIDNINLFYDEYFDWSQNNLYNIAKESPNLVWLHHFQSLRWLKKIEKSTNYENTLIEGKKNIYFEIEYIYSIIKSFLKFFINNYNNLLNEQKFSITNTWLDDHATSIRLDILVELYDKLKLYDIDFSIYIEVLQIHIKILIVNRNLTNQPKLKWTDWSRGVYRDKHNHGIMSCVSVINTLHIMPLLATDEILELSYKRYREQIDWLWTIDGCTREHSLSYQIYNIDSIISLLNIIDKYGDKYENKYYLLNIIEKSQNLILYSIQYDRTLFSIGDTNYTSTNEYILKNLKKFNLLNSDLDDIYFKKNFKILTHKFFYSEISGYFVLRDVNYHMFFMCSNFSHIHKNCDDLSICLNINSCKLLIDAGYSGKKNVICHKTTSLRAYHNTLVLKEELSDNDNYWNQIKTRTNTKIIKFENINDIYIVIGVTNINTIYFHKRIIINLLKYNAIIIYDITDYYENVYSIFNLGEKTDIIVNDIDNNKMMLVNNNNKFEFITNNKIITSKSLIWIDNYNTLVNNRLLVNFLHSNSCIIKPYDDNIIENIFINNNILSFDINNNTVNIEII